MYGKYLYMFEIKPTKIYYSVNLFVVCWRFYLNNFIYGFLKWFLFNV